MVQQSTDTSAPKEPLFTQSPEQLKAMLESLHQQKFPVDRLESLATAADGRKELVADFQRITGTNGNAQRVMEELSLYSKEAHRGEKFIEDSQTPEKKNILRRSWDGMKGMVWKHPYVTATLILALAAGGIAAGYYLAGEWELLMTTLGFNKIAGLAETLNEVAPVTPLTPALPGGGFYDVPPPLPTPGGFPDVPH